MTARASCSRCPVENGLRRAVMREGARVSTRLPDYDSLSVYPSDPRRASGATAEGVPRTTSRVGAQKRACFRRIGRRATRAGGKLRRPFRDSPSDLTTPSRRPSDSHALDALDRGAPRGSPDLRMPVLSRPSAARHIPAAAYRETRPRGRRMCHTLAFDSGGCGNRQRLKRRCFPGCQERLATFPRGCDRLN